MFLRWHGSLKFSVSSGFFNGFSLLDAGHLAGIQFFLITEKQDANHFFPLIFQCIGN